MSAIVYIVPNIWTAGTGHIRACGSSQIRSCRPSCEPRFHLKEVRCNSVSLTVLNLRGKEFP
jgi:hypothetical protein